MGVVEGLVPLGPLGARPRLDPNGRNGVWWPGFTVRLWQQTRRFDTSDYELVAAA